MMHSPYGDEVAQILADLSVRAEPIGVDRRS